MNHVNVHIRFVEKKPFIAGNFQLKSNSFAEKRGEATCAWKKMKCDCQPCINETAPSCTHVQILTL